MRVLLTHSYFLQLDVKQLNTGSPYPPLATLYAASLLQSNGFDVKVADLQFGNESDIEPFLADFKPDVFVIYDDGFNYLTKMCLTNMREAAFSMQQRAKKYNIPVIVSSSDATDHLAGYCNSGADYIIIGEAEQTLLELVSAFRNQTSASGIRGIAFLKDQEIVKTPARTVSRQLDELPPPAWDLIDLTGYEKIWLAKHGYFSLNFVTTRGCPYKCNWCAKPIYGNRYNSHSPEYIVDLIKNLQQKINFRHIWFADDIFGLKPGWLKEFAELIKKENICIRYKIQSRADLLLEDENIRYLAESGCETVWMGAESGSQRILDAMDKGITTEQIETAVFMLKKHNIRQALFLQFGYPGEEAEDIVKTVDMIRHLLPDDIGISVSYPLPGTKFYENVKHHLLAKSNWTDSDDLHLMFKNTFEPEFYRHLHRYVHHSYRASQAKKFLFSLDFTNYKRIGLWPYYSLQMQREKKALKKIEPLAASFL